MFSSPPLPPLVGRSSSFSGTSGQLLFDGHALPPSGNTNPSPPPSSRPEATTIDHTALPHIYENIMDQERQEHFSVFRRLNKWNALRFDRRMARHIGVCATHACQEIPFDGREVVHEGIDRNFWPTACHRRCPCHAVIFSVKHSKSGSRALSFPALQLRNKFIPWDEYALDAPTATWLSSREDLLSFNTQVLDVVGHVPKAEWIKQRVWEGRNLHMIRFIPVPIHLHRVHPTPQLLQQSAEVFTADIGVVFFRPRWFSFEDQICVPIRMIDKTLAIHVDVPAGSSEDVWEKYRESHGPYRGGHLQIWFALDGWDYNGPHAEIVYIFDKAWIGMDIPQSSSGTPQAFNMFYVPARRLAMVIEENLGHSIVFVGAESLPPNVVDLTGFHELRKYFPDEYAAKSSFDPEGIRLAILVTVLLRSLCLKFDQDAEVRVATSTTHNSTVQTLADRVLDLVHFKTRKEYCQEVGTKDWHRMTKGYSWQL